MTFLEINQREHARAIDVARSCPPEELARYRELIEAALAGRWSLQDLAEKAGVAFAPSMSGQEIGGST